MVARRPALRAAIAIFSAYVLVLQLLLAGLAGRAVAGTAEGALCAASEAVPGSGDASRHAFPGGDCCAGAVADAPGDAAVPPPPHPQRTASAVRHGAAGASAGPPRGRHAPPARAPPA